MTERNLYREKVNELERKQNQLAENQSRLITRTFKNRKALKDFLLFYNKQEFPIEENPEILKLLEYLSSKVIISESGWTEGISEAEFLRQKEHEKSCFSDPHICGYYMKGPCEKYNYSVCPNDAMMFSPSADSKSSIQCTPLEMFDMLRRDNDWEGMLDWLITGWINKSEVIAALDSILKLPINDRGFMLRALKEKLEGK